MRQRRNVPDLGTLEGTLLACGRHYGQIAWPFFEWTFTCEDLDRLLEGLGRPPLRLQLAA